jgi:hypothetical protein
MNKQNTRHILAMREIPKEEDRIQKENSRICPQPSGCACAPCVLGKGHVEEFAQGL